MRPITRLTVALIVTFVVVGCNAAATSAPTGGEPTAAPTATPAPEPTATSTPTPAPTATPTTTVEASCIDVTDAGEATTIEAHAASFAWSPSEITAAVGEVITWTNRDRVPHRVATDDGTCRMTSNIGGGGSRSLQFTTAGEYPFFCTLHPDMTGTIIITE